MKYLLLPIIIMSILLSGEMEVDGNLKVTGTIQNDSLAQVIAQLEARIAQLECINSGNIPAGYCDCFGNVLDVCGICGGDTILEDDCMPTDIDGNTYETVEIGDQVWMAENLKVTHYNNGDAIATELDDSVWISTTEGAYAIYDNDPANAEIYGNLYNWYAVNDDRGICPADYHVPSDEEFLSLSNYLGGDDIAGGKMKEIGIEHWSSPNTGATNESGFTGLPAGYRISNFGSYYNMGNYGYFWSSSEGSHSAVAWSWILNYDSSSVSRGGDGKRFGFNVRCIKD